MNTMPVGISQFAQFSFGVQISNNMMKTMNNIYRQCKHIS